MPLRFGLIGPGHLAVAPWPRRCPGAVYAAARPFVNTLEIAGTRGVALCRSTPDLRRMTLQLFGETLEEEATIEASGHTNDIVFVLNDFDRAVREGPRASPVLATGEDG